MIVVYILFWILFILLLALFLLLLLVLLIPFDYSISATIKEKASLAVRVRWALFQFALLILAETDVVTAAEALLTARKTAEGLDPTLTSPAVPMTVKELIAQIGTSLDKSSGKAAEILRVQGRTAYDAADYKTSLDLYLRAYKLQPLYYNGAVAYYCGKNYQALKQYDQAKPYYEFVIEHFPGSQIASYSAVRLTEMGFATAPSTSTTASTTSATAPTTSTTTP